MSGAVYCISCGIRIRLPDKGDEPGTPIRFACPRCECEQSEVVPWEDDADEVELKDYRIMEGWEARRG